MHSNHSDLVDFAYNGEGNYEDFEKELAYRIVERLGPSIGTTVRDGSYEELEKLALDMAERGERTEKYNTEKLRKLRAFASRFPKETMVVGLSLQHHMLAGTPRMLKRVQDRAAGTKLTRTVISELRRQIEIEDNPPSMRKFHNIIIDWTNKVESDWESDWKKWRDTLDFDDDAQRDMVVELMLTFVNRTRRLLDEVSNAASRLSPNRSHLKLTGE